MSNKHLAEVFGLAEKHHSGLLEPYTVMLVDAERAEDRRDIMRAGLRETFRQRYPMPEGFYQAIDRALTPKPVRATATA